MLAICLAVMGLAGIVSAEDTNVPVTAQQLLDDVIAQLPQEPLDVTGDIILRKRHGVVLRELKFQMLLKWGENPSKAQYTIRDAAGKDLEQLTVVRGRGKDPVFKYSAGRGEAQPPDLSGAIQGTDISWMDLTLSFLWWKGGRITADNEEVKGRTCYEVEVPAPAAYSGPYAKVRIWVDGKRHMLVQAEGVDARDKQIRILWVKSIKKINDRWMLKDLEVQSSPIHRTKLVVREVNGEKTGFQEEGGADSSGHVTPFPVEEE